MKRLSSLVPEVFFAMLGVAYLAADLLGNGNINYIALLVSWLLFLQIIYRNRYIGILYGTVFVATSALRLMSLQGEYLGLLDVSLGEHPVNTYLFFGLSFIMAAAMVVKYVKAHDEYDENSLTISL